MCWNVFTCGSLNQQTTKSYLWMANSTYSAVVIFQCAMHIEYSICTILSSMLRMSWVSSYTTTVYINQNPVKHRLEHFLKTATYSWTIHRNVCDKYLSELPHLRFCRQTGFLRKSAIFQEIKILEVRVADKVLDNRWYRKKKLLF